MPSMRVNENYELVKVKREHRIRGDGKEFDIYKYVIYKDGFELWCDTDRIYEDHEEFVEEKATEMYDFYLKQAGIDTAVEEIKDE